MKEEKISFCTSGTPEPRLDLVRPANNRLEPALDTADLDLTLTSLTTGQQKIWTADLDMAGGGLLPALRFRWEGAEPAVAVALAENGSPVAGVL